jgi:hypothetical protein
LLPRIGQTSTQSKRQFCEVIFSQALSQRVMSNHTYRLAIAITVFNPSKNGD